jgi:single-stranded DNA-specific DHH superfamily exonuclease
MCTIKKEYIKKLKEERKQKELSLVKLEQDLRDSWNDESRYLELLREQRITRGDLSIIKTKLINMERGKELLAR